VQEAFSAVRIAAPATEPLGRAAGFGPQSGDCRDAAAIAGHKDPQTTRQGTQMTTIRLLAPAALAALIAIAAAQPAAAQADEAMLARLKSYMAEQGSPIEWNDVDTYTGADDEEITSLVDVRIAGQNGEVSLTSVDLSEITREGEGWKIGRLAIPSFNQKVEDSEFVVYDTTVSDFVLPAEGQAAPALPYGGLQIRELAFNVHENEILKASDLHVEVETEGAGKPAQFSGAVEAFHLNLDSLKDPETQQAVDALGYRKLGGYIEFDGKWDEAAGRLALDKYDVSIEDAGTLGVSFDVAGVGLPLLGAMARLQAQMAANPGGDNTMAGIQAMGLLAQTTLHSARIEFQDDSLTDRALDLTAKDSGQDRAAIAAAAAQAVEQWAGFFRDPALTRQASDAVARFLAEPGNITIAVEPPAPVSGAEIAMGALQGTPGLAQQLGIKVEANE
jgi:hypothetical protein